MSSSRALLLSGLLAVAQGSLTTRTNEVKSDKDCDCYLTDGIVPEYYTNHAFFDFRSLSQYAGVPDAIDSYAKSKDQPPSSEYFNGDEWSSTWGLQDWGNADGTDKAGKGVSLMGDATLKMTNTLSNVYIEENKDKNADSDTYLTMRTKRFKKFQSAAEFETIDLYHHVSIRMLARVSGSPGACLALFTYRDPHGGHSEDIAQTQEADIEILTKDPEAKISYTNQPAFDDEGEDIPEATRNATLPGGKKWSEWVEHRLDWTPEMSTWYVDGEKAAKIGFQAPRDPAQIMLNAWSDGGSWSGVMPVGEEAFLQIKWIEMVYNTTSEVLEEWDDDEEEEESEKARKRRRRVKRSAGPRGQLVKRKGDGECSVVCSIDENEEVGKPVKIEADVDEGKGGDDNSGDSKDSKNGEGAENDVVEVTKDSGALKLLGSILPVVLTTGATALMLG